MPGDDHDVRHVTMHKLQAVTTCTLVQLCLWTKHSEGAGSDSDSDSERDTLAEVIEASKDLKNMALRSTITQLLSETLPDGASRTQPEVDSVWERYAVTHLQGRLLPSCCNLACTNLGGVCEAAMKTQLCSGCRRARYCSVGCQRAAWLEGGHSLVCGK